MRASPPQFGKHHAIRQKVNDSQRLSTVNSRGEQDVRRTLDDVSNNLSCTFSRSRREVCTISDLRRVITRFLVTRYRALEQDKVILDDNRSVGSHPGGVILFLVMFCVCRRIRLIFTRADAVDFLVEFRAGG